MHPGLAWSAISDYKKEADFDGEDFETKGNYCPNEYIVFYGAESPPPYYETDDSHIWSWVTNPLH